MHKVGLTAVALGLPAFLLLPFATFAPNRVVTGTGHSALESLGPGWTGLVVTLWLTLAVFSARDDRKRPAALARGLTASAVLLVTVAGCEVAALRLLSNAGPIARVSVGSGAWLSAIMAYSAVLASRRELGVRTMLGAALTALPPAGVGSMLVTGFLADLGILREYANQHDRFWAEAVRHSTFSVAALSAATLIGFALGWLAFRYRRLQRPVFMMVNVFQTVPGLAMVGLLFVPLAWLRQNSPLFERLGVGGLGWAPVVTALVLYGLLAVTRNTYAGLRSVPPEVVEAGAGMGMTTGQVLLRVRVPVAMPVLFSGLRTATVQTVGNATLGAFVAAGTFGLFIFGGLSQQAADLTMLGSVSLVALALAADGALRVAQRAVVGRRPRGRGTA